LGVVSGVIFRFGPESFTFIYNKWVGLITASLAMGVFQAIYCYIASFREGKLLALGGNSGNIIYDVSASSHREECSVSSSLSGL
jgi:Delta14-sterol reductase